MNKIRQQFYEIFNQYDQGLISKAEALIALQHSIYENRINCQAEMQEKFKHLASELQILDI